MKLTSLIVAAMTAGAATFASAQATPFGLREGTSKSDLELLVGPLSAPNGSPPSYYVARVPKPHPDLTVYAVEVGDSTGLCQVVAGKLIDSTGVTDIGRPGVQRAQGAADGEIREADGQREGEGVVAQDQ